MTRPWKPCMGRTLYHFTSPSRVDSIKKIGIVKGDVPITMKGGFNAPWLTDDPSPTIQKWIVGTDKDKIRMTVEIKNETKLRKWSTYAQSAGVPDEWYKILDLVGGGGSDNWYIFLGRIPPQWIKEIEYL